MNVVSRLKELFEALHPSEDAKTIADAIAYINELRTSLQWYVDNDDVNEGDDPVERLDGQSWNEYNAWWIEGKRTAEQLIQEGEV